MNMICKQTVAQLNQLQDLSAPDHRVKAWMASAEIYLYVLRPKPTKCFSAIIVTTDRRKFKAAFTKKAAMLSQAPK